MVANQSLRLSGCSRANQRTQPSEAANNLLKTQWRTQVGIELAQHVLRFRSLHEHFSFKVRLGFGRANQQSAEPGNSEEHAAIFGLGYNQRIAALKQFQREENVDTFAEAKAVRQAWVSERTHGVRKRSRRVDESARMKCEALARQGIFQSRCYEFATR